LPVKEDGNFEILIQAGRKADAGVYQMSLDGRVIGEALDLGVGMDLKRPPSLSDQMFFQQSQYAVQLQEISLGRHYLCNGDHKISVEALGPGRHSGFALDYVRLRTR
jgi:hypothetical protein